MNVGDGPMLSWAVFKLCWPFELRNPGLTESARCDQEIDVAVGIAYSPVQRLSLTPKISQRHVARPTLLSADWSKLGKRRKRWQL